ncbi:MAG: GTPase [Gulosibacter sp.]|uniref:GTPase n=1 Tax=Gulosibacter sp. TaxID=2817531 RepID=UPI003F902F9C
MTTEAPKTASKPQPNSATLAFRQLGAAAKTHDLGDRFSGIARMIKETQGRLPSVVVVGEMNRGKSTLINAILGAPGTAPVGATETTGLAVNYIPEHEKFPFGQAELEYASEPRLRRIPAEELDQWVRIDSPELLNADEPPLQASRAVKQSPLGRVALVDTPGSGGLSEAYAMRAIARAQDASVLLIVTDASGRITKPALEFLAHCSTMVESVVLAVTKIDLYRGHWQAVLEENRQILAERDQRLGNIPIVPVSGAWGERAASEPNEERRRKLYGSSNVHELIRALRTPLERSTKLPTLNALRRGIALLETPLVQLQAEREALGGIVEKHDNLIAVREHREKLLRTFEDSKYDWNSQVDRVRVDLTSANARLSRQFGAHWKDRVQKYGTGMGEKQSVAIMNEMAADVEVQAGRALRGIVQRSGGLLTDLYAAAGMDPQNSLLQEVERRATEAGTGPKDGVERGTASVDPRMILSGVMMGSGIGGAVSGLGAFLGLASLTVLPLFTIPLMTGFSVLLARRQAKRQSVLQTVNDVTMELRETLDRAVRSVLGVVSTDAKKVFDRDLRQSATEAKTELARLESAKRASESERERRLAQINPKIDQLQQAMGAAHDEILRLTDRSAAANP